MSLSEVPRIPIGKWPTPLRRLDYSSRALGCDVWAKVEEECGAWGGNKVRKLEYLLAEARAAAATKLVAYGAGSSSWAAATALHGRDHGFDVTLGLGGAVPVDYARLYGRLGTRVMRLPTLASVPAAALVARARAGKGARLLPPGGSGGVGDLGSFQAGVEVADAVERGDMPEPSHAFVPAGTGGTCAGLGTGMALRNLHCRVVAIRVTPRPLGTLWLVGRRMSALNRRLSQLGVRSRAMSFVEGIDACYPPGYGKPSKPAIEAAEMARLDGLQLDLTYAAKAFAGLIATVRTGISGPVLFLHTSPGPLPDR